MKQERLIGTAKKLDKILKFVQIVNCVAIVLGVCGVLILSIAYWINPASVNVPDTHTVHLGEAVLEIVNVSGTENGIGLSYAWMNVAVALVLLAIICIGFRYVRKILIPMMEGNPFDISVSENLKKLSLVSLAYGIIGNISSVIMTSMKMQHYHLGRLADAEEIVSVTVYYQFQIEFLVVFLVFLLASYIFRYGAELQQLSDETL